MDHTETVAKLVLEAVLPGARLEYRLAQSNGEHDFDLHYHDGTVAAVEVTSSVDQIKKQTGAAIRSTKKAAQLSP
jgi:hypothetical protein